MYNRNYYAQVDDAMMKLCHYDRINQINRNCEDMEPLREIAESSSRTFCNSV